MEYVREIHVNWLKYCAQSVDPDNWVGLMVTDHNFNSCFYLYSNNRHTRLHWHSLTKKTISSATVKSTARPSCLVGVLYDIYRETINRSTANQPLLRNWPRKLPNSAKYKLWLLRRSRSFEVTDFVPIDYRNPIYDFLLVITTNLPPILHRFQVMSDYCNYVKF